MPADPEEGLDYSRRATAVRHYARAESIALAVIVMVGLVLRLLGLDGQSLTMDEVTELDVARRPTDLAGLIKGARRFPPLYHLVLRGWQALFPGDLSARVLSVVLGLLSIAAVYYLARWLAGRRVAFWVALLVAVSPFHIWYSQETRVYGLDFLLAALTLLLFYRGLDTDSVRDWVLFVVAATAGVFTHYYFPVLLIVLAGTALVAKARDRSRPRRALAAFLALAFVAIPWAWLLLQDLHGAWGASRLSGFGPSGFGYTYLSFITGYTVGPSLRELHDLSGREVVASAGLWLAVIAVSLVVLIKSGFVALGSAKWRASLVALAVAPVALVGLTSEIGPFGYNVRHVVWVFIPVSIWLGAGLSRWRSSRAVVGAGLALLAVSGVALANRHRSDNYRNEDSRAVARFLDAYGDRVPVFVCVDYMIGPLEHYLEDDWELRGVPVISDPELRDRTLADISGQLAEHGYVWLAYSRAFHGDPDGTLLDAVAGQYAVVLEATFAGFRLYRIVGPSQGAD